MPTEGTREIDEWIADLEEHHRSDINPTGDQLRSLLEADRDGPLDFVNLLRFHATAIYPAGHALGTEGLSGASAYAKYGVVALREVTARGGRLVLLNDVEQSVIGSGNWDQVAIMSYPNTTAFTDMIRAPAYVEALEHRDAGLADTLVLVTRPLLSTS
jgi:uncharacterized protein (DUF1330 family)